MSGLPFSLNAWSSDFSLELYYLAFKQGTSFCKLFSLRTLRLLNTLSFYFVEAFFRLNIAFLYLHANDTKSFIYSKRYTKIRNELYLLLFPLYPVDKIIQSRQIRLKWLPRTTRVVDSWSLWWLSAIFKVYLSGFLKLDTVQKTYFSLW